MQGRVCCIVSPRGAVNSPCRAALGYPPMTSQKGESYHCTAGFRARTDESAGDTS